MKMFKRATFQQRLDRRVIELSKMSASGAVSLLDAMALLELGKKMGFKPGSERTKI